MGRKSRSSHPLSSAPSRPMAGVAPGPVPGEEIPYYIAKGHRLRAEALAGYGRAARRTFAGWLGALHRRDGTESPDERKAVELSHRLRTPLTAIQSASEIPRDNPDIPLAQRNRFLDAILEESRRLNRAINETLDDGGGGPRRLAG